MVFSYQTEPPMSNGESSPPTRSYDSNGGYAAYYILYEEVLDLGITQVNGLFRRKGYATLNLKKPCIPENVCHRKDHPRGASYYSTCDDHLTEAAAKPVDNDAEIGESLLIDPLPAASGFEQATQSLPLLSSPIAAADTSSAMLVTNDIFSTLTPVHFGEPGSPSDTKPNPPRSPTMTATGAVFIATGSPPSRHHFD
ncbi:hypothetical protein MUCCIDRAFT_110720 [Mucor lusitanicus CBS 277.49]|uniref:Uncharacterized protein n=1 Tax=Mucor lusitanicus CBS 277.49 TaxID=747725 RepID=A0A168LQS1_MUCCL|nr:hypothetical protein MUCCIDRAFT_110720 [Mucor lusitanicus CBS 277.49]